MKSNFNVQFATQRLREEENRHPVDDSYNFIMNIRDLDTEIQKSQYSKELFTLSNSLRSEKNVTAALDTLEKIKNKINLDDTIDRVSKANTIRLIQKIEAMYPQESLGENSSTPGEGAFLTIAGAKRQPPKPTSGYKEVKGYRPGHSKLNIVQTKDLWNLNEFVSTPDKENINALLQAVKAISKQDYMRLAYELSSDILYDYEKIYNWLPKEIKTQLGNKFANIKSNKQISEVGNKIESEQGLTYSNGEKIKVGDKVTTHEGDTGDVVGFQKASRNNEETVFVTLTRQENGGSTPVPKDSFFAHQLTPKKSEEPLKEGIRTEIKQRNKSQQFHEAARMVNKKLREINNILEYAEQLKRDLDESARPNHLMEKMKKEIVSAYKKMREL